MSEAIRRKPLEGLSTPRKEEDNFEIVSGYFNGYTTGAGLKNRFSNLESDKVYVGKDKSTYHNYNNSYTDNNNRGYGLY